MSPNIPILSEDEFNSLGQGSDSSGVPIIDESQWQQLPANDPPGWLESLGTSVEKGIGNIAQGIGGGVSYLEDKLGTGTGVGQAILDQEAQYQAPRINLLSQVERGSPQYYANSVAEGVTSGLPMLLSGGPLAAASASGGLAFGNQYQRAKELGATPEDAQNSALLQGGANALFTVPVFQAAQSIGPLAQRMLATGAINTATSVPATLSQAYADAIAQQSQVQPYDLIQPFKENAITAGLTGALMPVAVSGARALRGVDQPANAKAIGAELRDRFLNRPVLPEDPAAQPQANPTKLLTDSIETAKQAVEQVAPDLVDPAPLALPEPDPIVPTQKEVAAPSEAGESFPVPLDPKDSQVLAVQKNQANPDPAPSVETVLEADQSSWAKLAKKAVEMKVTELDPTQAWFQGQIFGKDVPVVSNMLSALRKTSMPRTISRKFPEAKDLYFKGGRAEVENEALVASEMTQLLNPYFRSDNPQLVDAIIGQTREITKQFDRERYQAQNEFNALKQQAKDLVTGKVQFNGDPEAVKAYADQLVADGQKKLDAISARKTPRLTVDDIKALGGTENDAKAIFAHKDAMNYGLERLREVLKLQGRKIRGKEDQANYNSDVDQYINNLVDTNYFPARRYENAWAVELKDADGNTLYRNHAASKGEAKKIAVAAQKDFKNATEVNVSAIPQVDFSAFPDLPANLAENLKQFDPSKYSEISKGRPVVGFSRHLIEAGAIPGYDPNIRKSTVDYALGLARYYGRQQAKAALDDIVSNLPEGSAIRGYATRYAEGQLVKPESPVVKGVLKFQNFMKLAGVPTSALINTTQTITTTLPKLEGELIKAYGAPRAVVESAKVLPKVTLQAFGYLADRIGGKPVGGFLRKQNPELFSFLDEASKTGILDSEGMRELYNHKQKIQGNMTAADSLMFMFSTAEQANRTIALLAAREAGKAQGLKGQQLFDYAKDFVTSTQFDQTIANRPPAISHGLGRIITQYRPFQLNYFRFIRDNFNKQDWPVVGLSVAAMAGLGGALALPFAKDAERIAESFGLSPVRAFRRFMTDEKWADRMLYGLPMDAGVSISGAVSPGEFTAQDVSGQGLAKLFGPTADYLINQLPKAYDSLKNKDNPVAAFEIAGPRFTRGPMKALRAMDQSRGGAFGLKNVSDRVILPNVTAPEAAALAFGATPARLQKEQEIISQEFKILAAGKQKPKDFNRLLAEGFMAKDMTRVKDLMGQIRDYNLGLRSLPEEERLNRAFVPNFREIVSQMKQRFNPQLGVMLEAPKKSRPAIARMYQEYGKIKKRPVNAIEE